MTAKELRAKFLEFFKARGHTVIPSASLVPENDPTVLFTTAGMHPLVPYLLGQAHPGGRRLTSVQKSMRTDDIDEVGDGVHNTFFEMLGNWSLGDYWKKEAIEWSYEFLTGREWLGLPADKLAVSVFAGDKDAAKDEETAEIWKRLGIAENRIAYLPKKNNWWGPAGLTGPCGPDTEMFYWIGAGAPPANFQNTHGDPHWVEIWNDVFMQYDKQIDGTFQPLKQRNVDTGMGLERMVTVLQGKDSVYETELFSPILEKIRSLAKKQDTKAERIVADHLRAATFIIADGVTPSNKDRGNILRRLIRRAMRHGLSLGIEQEFCAEIGAVVIHEYSEAYPVLLKYQEKIVDELAREDLKFRKTLPLGLKYFEKLSTVDGKAMFDLFQTYGFPLELTEELLREREAKLAQPPVVMASTGNLKVSIAKDTPNSGVVVKGAARVPFTKVNFTATGGDTVIDSLTVERTGPSDDSNFQDIILLDVSDGVSVGEAQQISSEQPLNSQHKVIFKGPIRIVNGTTKSVMLAANMASSLNSADRASLALVDMALVGSAARSGSLLINGNLMTMNNLVMIAAVTVKASAFPSATMQRVGTQDYAVASFQIINDSVEKAEVSKVVFTQSGSADDSDIRNIRLVVDGSVTSKLDKPANRTIAFILDRPEVLDKGQTKNFVIRLDVVNGLDQTVELKIVSKADVVAKGMTFGYYVLPYYQNSAGMSVTKPPFYRSAWTEYKTEFEKHQQLSRTSSAGRFRGGLADHQDKTIRLHTATHLLQAGLRKVLGEHLFQKGSHVTAERTRFDFNHPNKVSPEEIRKVEDWVNEQIKRDLPMKREIMSLEEARKLGAIGLFDEKYGDKVSIYTISDPGSGEVVSREFCGGPHVEHTGQIGRFRIAKEEAVASGIRRIKATVGEVG